MSKGIGRMLEECEGSGSHGISQDSGCYSGQMKSNGFRPSNALYTKFKPLPFTTGWPPSILPAPSHALPLAYSVTTTWPPRVPILSSNTYPTCSPIFSFLTIFNYVFLLFCSSVLTYTPSLYFPSANTEKPAPNGLSWS